MKQIKQGRGLQQRGMGEQLLMELRCWAAPVQIAANPSDGESDF
jgi:hypothetical protein